MYEEGQQSISFNEFELDRERQRLTRNGEPIEIYAKTFELLAFLVENKGRLLTKDEILDKVWKDQFVEEANLSVQISALRRALGETADNPRLLVTVPGKGYKFIGNISGANSEIVIERHKLSHAVVEEEGFVDQAVPSGEPAKQSKRLRDIFFAFGMIGTMLVAALTGYWFYKSRSKKTLGLAKVGDMKMTQLTDGRQVGAASLSPNGRFVAYVENSGAGKGTLFIRQIDTNSERSIIEPATRTFGCTNFSPDNSLIYYIVFDKNDPDAVIYSVPVLGGTPKRIVSNLSPCFTISPDGKEVAFFRRGSQKGTTNLVATNVNDGSERILLTRSYQEMSFGLGLAWSPDGESIAFAATSEPTKKDATRTIYNLDIKSGEVEPLTSDTFSGIGKMAWTGDGEDLIFIGHRPKRGSGIYVLNRGGTVNRITSDLYSWGNYGMGVSADARRIVASPWNVQTRIWKVSIDENSDSAVRLTDSTSSGQLGLSSSPDGRIVFTERASRGRNIWSISDDGTHRKALTNDRYSKANVTVSPDGRFIFFSSNQTGTSKIFRMNSKDGSDVRQISDGQSSDSHPNVSPDGKWVIYTSRTKGKSTIRKVSINGGESIQLTDYESGGAVYSQDGKTFACLLRSPSRAIKASIAIVSSQGGKPLDTFKSVQFFYGYKPLRWNPDGNGVAFIRTTKGISNIWSQSVAGGEPVQLTDFTSELIYNFAFSRDGRHILLSRGSTAVDPVLIEFTW